MKELDFDELDKAVSSLVSQTKKITPKSSADLASTKPTSVTRAAAVSDSSPSKAQTVNVSVTPGRRTPRLGVKPSQSQQTKGSFIDVMTPKPKSSAAKTPNRLGVSIKPPELSSKSSAPAEKPSIKPVKTPSLPELTDAKEHAAAPKSETKKVQVVAEHWPDPLDFHAEGSAPEAEAPKPAATSPFLPDAKVEKRPLGAFGSSSGNPDDKKVKPEVKSSPIELQPEFEPEAEPKKIDKPVITAPEEAVESTEQIHPQHDGLGEPSPEPVALLDEPEKVEKQVRDSALLSIPQQYKRETQAANEATRPVFDTKEYHLPLLEATTHRSNGVLRVVIIIILLLAVIAGGYAAFSYFVQH